MYLWSSPNFSREYKLYACNVSKTELLRRHFSKILAPVWPLENGCFDEHIFFKLLQWLFLKFISCFHNVSITFPRIFISSRSVHCQRSVHWVYSNLWVIWGLWWAIFNSWFCLQSFLGQELQVAVVFAPLGNKRMPLAALEMNEVFLSYVKKYSKLFMIEFVKLWGSNGKLERHYSWTWNWCRLKTVHLFLRSKCNDWWEKWRQENIT